MSEVSRALNGIFEGIFSLQGVFTATVIMVLFFIFVIWLPAQDPLYDVVEQEEERGESE